MGDPPAQIALAHRVFAPTRRGDRRGASRQAAFDEAEAQGLGAAHVDGVMIDAAVLRLVRNTLGKADLIGM